MAWYDYLNPVYDFKKLTGIGNSPQQPGVGGPNAGGSAGLVQDPSSGYWYNPATGTTYTDQTGQTPVTDPNVAQQVAASFKQQQQFLAGLGKGQQQQEQAFGGQTKLAGSLQNTISNPNAPSVAQLQLADALGGLQRQQLSGAAGVGGVNSVLAQREAERNIGDMGVRAAGQAAQVRAGEVANAQGQLGQVLGQQGQEGQGRYNAELSGALGFGGNALQGQMGQQGLNQKTNEDNQKGLTSIAGGLASGIGAGLAVSDERAKDDVRDEPDAHVSAFLDHLAGKSFKYKGDDEPRHGVVAQDVEKSPMGKSIVKNVGGVKALSVPDGLGAILASLGQIHKRVGKLEHGHR